jgi:YebC/PmpR family DNA-binding regulatory protein
MSGHSKWSTIKHKKGAADAKRGKLFTKLIREITVSARTGGGDPTGNPRLRSAIAAARAANMPGDNVDRAIKRGTGELEGVEYEEVTYEGYGPGGAAVLVESLTDNRNRTVSEVRHLFSKYNGNMGEAGCVSWMFSRVGVIVLQAEGVDEEELMEQALEAGADDVKREEDLFEVHCGFSDVDEVAEKLREVGFSHESARPVMLPQSTIRLEGRDAEVMLRLVEMLEDQDDVQNVWSNFDIDDAELDRLAGQ